MDAEEKISALQPQAILNEVARMESVFDFIKEDLEKQIAVLEKRIKIIERDIATASDSQNGSEVAKLGEEYNQLQIEIAEALEKWADA